MKKDQDLMAPREKIQCAFDKMVPVHKLVVNPKNPNKHPEKQIDLLSKIIDYQGQRSPIVVSLRSGFIVKGHGRLEAIMSLGWLECAVDYQEYDDEAQEFADMIADNKIAELANHDDEMFKLEALNLQLDVSGFDLDLLGVPDLILNSPENFLDDKPDTDQGQTFKVEVLCVNGDEMTALVDELSGRGLIAKAIFRG